MVVFHSFVLNCFHFALNFTGSRIYQQVTRLEPTNHLLIMAGLILIHQIFEGLKEIVLFLRFRKIVHHKHHVDIVFAQPFYPLIYWILIEDFLMIFTLLVIREGQIRDSLAEN